MRKIYFIHQKLTGEEIKHEMTSNDDFNSLDYKQANLLDRLCDEFYELSEEEQKTGFRYGEWFIIEEN